MDDLAAPQQTPLTIPLRGTHNIAGQMNTIGSVHIQPPGRAEHGSILLRHAPVGVGGRVGGAQVCLHLGDPYCHIAMAECCS